MSTPMEDEDAEYARALDALSSMITQVKRSDGLNWESAFAAMHTYVDRLELGAALGRLSVIHVAGTKGKGSTCAFVESILRKQGLRTGLFTSPHLVDVRERIRLGGRPVSRTTFLHHFWWAHDRLKETATEEHPMPAYFRFITLLALRIFDAEAVDVAVLEVGLGGRLDATNVVPKPAVCGISSLGYDHMELLGYTLREIAWEKAGIIKAGVPAYTSPQPEEAHGSLRRRADEVGAPLEVTQPLDAYGGDVKIGLAGEHQRTNAALAVQLCRTWALRVPSAAPPSAASDEQELLSGRLPQAYREGLAETSWPGRAQVLHAAAREGAVGETPVPGVPGLTFFLDGAHTPESTAHCGQWYADASASVAAGGAGALAAGLGGPNDGRAVQRMMLFNCKEERDPRKLLEPLVGELSRRGVHMHRALFVAPESTGITVKPTEGTMDATWQLSLRHTWDDLTSNAASRAAVASPAVPVQQPALPPGTDLAPGSGSAVLPSLAAALDWLRLCAREQRQVKVQVLVTGSLYLVGDVLRLLKRMP